MIIDRLNSLLQLTRRGLLQRAKLKAGESWGYGYHDRQEGLLEYYTAVHLLRNQALSTGICISNKELDIVESNIHRILGPECKTGQNDFFKGERSAEWALSNPDCVSYETWSEYLAAQCKKIGIDFKVSVQKCTDVGIDLKVVESQICDVILKPITVEEKVCKIDIDLKPVLQQCEIDFKLYIEPLNCDIDLKTYVHLIECGADVNLIVSQINCGATVDMLVRNIDACFVETEVPPTCLFSYECAPIGDCSFFVDNYDCGPGISDFINAYLKESIPTFHVMCGDCKFDIVPGYWTLNPEQIDEDGTYVINGTLTAFENCCGNSPDCFKYYGDPVCLLELGTTCDDTLSSCTGGCESIENPDEYQACIDLCSDSYGTCLQSCSSTNKFPSEACCNNGYVATLTTLPFSTTISEDFSPFQECPQENAGVLYLDITWVFSDSLGNQAQCDARYFQFFC